MLIEKKNKEAVVCHKCGRTQTVKRLHCLSFNQRFWCRFCKENIYWKKVRNEPITQTGEIKEA